MSWVLVELQPHRPAIVILQIFIIALSHPEVYPLGTPLFPLGSYGLLNLSLMLWYLVYSKRMYSGLPSPRDQAQ